MLGCLETGNLAVCLVELALEHLVLSSEALVCFVELVDLVLQMSGLLADKLQLRHHLLHLLMQGLNLLLVRGTRYLDIDGLSGGLYRRRSY